MLEVQKFLQTGKITDLESLFGINVKVYDDRLVFNYRIDSKPKFHPIVCECRGLIINARPGKSYNVLCRSFDRFFNYGEGDDKDTFDWNNCKVFNKLDGSLINVYHDGNKWCAATRGTAFAEGETPLGKTYHDLFIEAIGTDLEHGFENCSKHYTYIFELTSPENRIVTRYYKTSTTLLAIRNNLTGLYVDYDKINDYTCFNIKTEGLAPNYDLNNPEDIIEFVNNRDVMDEGVVCYDNITQKRIKIKNASYVAIHHLRGNEVTKKSIISLILKGETEEYFVYFDEDRERFEPYIKKYNEILSTVKKMYSNVCNIKDQKEFALKIKDFKYKHFLFSLRKGKKIEDLFNIDNLNYIIKFF